MLDLFFLLVMPILARMSGGGFGAKLLNKKGAKNADGSDKGGVMPVNLSMVPEILFGAMFGVAVTLATPVWLSWYWDVLIFLTVTGWSWGWMETGISPALQWGKRPEEATTVERDLTPVINFLAPRLGVRLGSRAWCWLWMAVKGFLIGMPVGGFLLAVLWPASYDLKVYTKSHSLTEVVSGLGAGLSIITFLNIFN